MKSREDVPGHDQTQEPHVAGTVTKDLTLIADPSMQHDLEIKGYGDYVNGRFILKPFESLYLLHCKRLDLKKAGKRIDFDTMMRVAKKFDSTIFTKFLIYRDLRFRGYTVKDGFGFGSDFRVYDRGRYGEKGARYVIFGFNEGTREKIHTLQKTVDQIVEMGKEPIIAVVERRGEIIYYKISKASFPPNRATGEPFQL